LIPHIAQRGCGRGPLVVAFHVAPQTLAKALTTAGMADATACAFVEQNSPPTWGRLLEDLATRTAWQGGPVVLAGWSMGAGAVNALLRAGARPEVTIMLDGGVGADMPPDPEVVRAWRDAANRARQGDGLVVLSHIYQTYTEGLPKPTDYPSTVRIVREATGLELPEPVKGMAEHRDRGLVVLSWQSDTIDGAAHSAQQTVALPLILARYVAPHLAQRYGSGQGGSVASSTQPGGSHVTAAPASSPSQPTAGGSSSSPAPPSTSSILRDGTGEAALEVALRELGVHEEPAGSNTGDRVRQYLAGCVRDLDGDGDLDKLGLTAAEWCASFVGWCDAQVGVPRTWRAAVHELVSDARAAGTLREVHEHTPRPGDLAIFMRNGSDPRRGGLGHVARVERVDGQQIVCIDGNHGDRVARVVRTMTDPSLVAWVEYPRRG
jgi:hypothetical protein